jgi:hypothetical protein
MNKPGFDFEEQFGDKLGDFDPSTLGFGPDGGFGGDGTGAGFVPGTFGPNFNTTDDYGFDDYGGDDYWEEDKYTSPPNYLDAYGLDPEEMARWTPEEWRNNDYGLEKEEFDYWGYGNEVTEGPEGSGGQGNIFGDGPQGTYDPVTGTFIVPGDGAAGGPGFDTSAGGPG